ncbi:MAG: PAS domain S-box protein [Spirochaetia bacterium]|nr:PAS domain S-box protein [Spirochaetia bacterium]
MSRKILLVEDEAIIAMSEARMLEKHGFEVSTVHSGERAVKAAASDSDIALILMDIDLGKGIDGTEAAERILETRDLPVVFLSSHTEPAVVEKTEGITSYGYIVKNSGETVLIASIRMAFRLWESENKFRKAFEYTSVGMVLTSPSGELLQLNKAFASMLGYSQAEIYSVNFSELTHPADVEMSVNQMKMMLDGKVDRREFTKRYIRKNGDVVLTDINSMLLRDSEGKPIHFVTHVQDITESKRMQEALDRQREQYDLLLRSAPISILVVQDGKYVYSNPNAAELLGYSSSQELIGTPIQNTFADDSLQRIEERMEKVEAGCSNPAQEITILRKDGKTICCESTSIPITFDSSPATLVIGRDLSVQKQAEAALMESRDKIASILKAAPTGIGVVRGRKKRIIVEANEKLCRMTGYSREDLIGKPARILYPSQEDFEYVGSEKYRQINAQGSGSVETCWKKKDGTVIQVLLASSPIHPADISLGVTFTAMDITERSQAEKSREKYRLLFNYSNDAIFVHEIGENNLPSKNIEVNEQATTLLQYSREELLNMSAQSVLPESSAKAMHLHAQELMRKKHLTFETENIRKDGVIIPIEVSAYLYTEGKKKFVVSSVRDITKRKQAEKTLARKSTLLEEAQKIANLGSWEWDIVHDTWYFSEQWKKIHGVVTNDLDTSKLIKIAHSEDAPYIEKAFSEAKEKGIPYNIEHRIIRADNREVRYIKALGEVEFDQDTGRAVRMVGTAQDITESKRTQEALQKAFEQKDFLMRELNHRVKNNLSMVSSLISLKDSEIEADLSDLKHRIHAIQLVHEKLQHHTELDRIEVREYFQELLQTIFSFSTDRNVRIVNKIEELSIPTKTAISLGLIANEIATNAIKYGFTSEEAIFTVGLTEDKYNQFHILSLSNSGNPFPEDIDIENTETSGLKLISILVRQLEGTLELEKKPSPKFTIRFPVDPIRYF